MTMPPQTAGPYGASPYGPTPTYMPMTASPRLGPGVSLIGTILIAIGTIVLAFALGSIGFGSPQTSGTYPNYTVTISAWSPGFTIGAVLIGIGILVRGFGTFLTRPGQG